MPDLFWGFAFESVVPNPDEKQKQAIEAIHDILDSPAIRVDLPFSPGALPSLSKT